MSVPAKADACQMPALSRMPDASQTHDPTEADGAGVGVRIGVGVGVRVGPGNQICEAGAILIVRVLVALLSSDVHVSASYVLICLHRGRGIGIFHRHGGRDKDLPLGA